MGSSTTAAIPAAVTIATMPPARPWARNAPPCMSAAPEAGQRVQRQRQVGVVGQLRVRHHHQPGHHSQPHKPQPGVAVQGGDQQPQCRGKERGDIHLPVLPSPDQAHKIGRQQVGRAGKERYQAPGAECPRREVHEHAGQIHVEYELPGQGAGQGQHKMQDRCRIEDVSATGLDRRHATEEVGVPERQAPQRADVLHEELSEHDAGRDGVLAQQHGALAAEQILAEHEQGEYGHDHERSPPGNPIEVRRWRLFHSGLAPKQ